VPFLMLQQFGQVSDLKFTNEQKTSAFVKFLLMDSSAAAVESLLARINSKG